MVLENPALGLNIKVDDILSILDGLLKEKNWKQFELANLKLLYSPYYLFNYDALAEQEVEGQTFSQGVSGRMAMDAVTGKLEPLLISIMEEQPSNMEKEITHGIEYEIISPTLREKELVEVGKIKLAGQLSVKKENIAVSGFQLVYWPVWRIWVSLPKKIQRIEVEAVAGTPLNFEEVPSREKTWLEVSQDTLEKLKKPEGWVEVSKKAAGVAAGGMRAAMARGGGGAPEMEGEQRPSSKIIGWLTHSRYGMILLLILILVIVVLFLPGGQKPVTPGAP